MINGKAFETLIIFHTFGAANSKYRLICVVYTLWIKAF